MEKEFIPYEQALALKELEFNEPCLGYYVGKDKEVYMSNEILSAPFQFRLESKTTFVAQTFSQAFRFFREKYNYLNAVFPNIHQKNWNYHIQYYDVNEMWGECYMKGDFKTYEEAELECLKKLIEITIA